MDALGLSIARDGPESFSGVFRRPSYAFSTRVQRRFIRGSRENSPAPSLHRAL